MIRFGVIGCGDVSRTYLYTLKENENSEIVAIADTEIKKAEKNSKIFGVKNAYDDYKKMLTCEKLDAIVICTPHYLHHDQALDCFRSGLDVLCEKPLATNRKDIFDMIENGRNVKFGVMLQRRFYPSSISTRKVINDGLLGKINEVSLNFSCHKTNEFYNTWRGQKISGGGTLISQALHRIDQLVYFFGPAKQVDGFITTTRPNIEVEDYAKGKIFFNGGIIADIESNNSSDDPRTSSIIKINGNYGNIILSDDKVIEWNVKNFPKPGEMNIKDIPNEYRPEYYGPAHELVINDFVDAIIYDRKPKICGEDSLPSMEIIFGFYKSAKENRKIYLENVAF